MSQGQEAAAILNRSSGYDALSDWRVPEIEELNTLVCCPSGEPQWFKTSIGNCAGSCSRPTVVAEAFPNTPRSYFWPIAEEVALIRMDQI